MPTTVPSSLLAAPPPARPRGFAVAALGYAALLLAAAVTGNAWLDGLAAFALASLLLWPALRRRSASAAGAWLGLGAGFAWLAAQGDGHAALDGIPVMINLALGALFARTLAPGREPLIARVIGVLEGRERLAQAGVARYARRLTLAWVLLFAAQAALLATILACRVPDGLCATLGLAPPLALAAAGWRWYLHLGSYALVFAFLLLEYAFRRWHLRHLPHASLPRFLARLVMRWPALARDLARDEPVG